MEQVFCFNSVALLDVVLDIVVLLIVVPLHVGVREECLLARLLGKRLFGTIGVLLLFGLQINRAFTLMSIVSLLFSFYRVLEVLLQKFRILFGVIQGLQLPFSDFWLLVEELGLLNRRGGGF